MTSVDACFGPSVSYGVTRIRNLAIIPPSTNHLIRALYHVSNFGTTRNAQLREEAVGEDALGEEVFGEEAVGEEALGEEALGEEALGEED